MEKYMDRSPGSLLLTEHRYITKLVGIVALHVEAIETGKAPDYDLLAEVVDFLQIYADQNHHGKEEALLFHLLEQKGVPGVGCPLGALKHEHVTGRALVAELAGLVTDHHEESDIATEELVICLKGLVTLYTNHIWKEDYLLLPMTDKVLTYEEQSKLVNEFDRADNLLGEEKIRRFEVWVEGFIM